MEQLVGVGVIIIRNDKILLGKRCGSHGAGTWGLTGGHLEAGEEIDDCAIRETLEETGIRLNNVRHAGFTNTVFESEDRQYITLFVETSEFSGEPDLREPDKCEQWSWFTLDDLPSPLFEPLASLFEQGYQPTPAG